MCTWSGYQKNPTNFTRKYPHRILSKRILHYQLPNSSMLFFDTFQRKLHSVWFKGYHAVFKNRPKKFSFPKKYTHRILSEQILHYQLPNSGMLFFDIFQRKLQSVWFKGYHAVFKNRPKKFSFPKKYTNRILSEQILHYQLSNSSMLFFGMFQRSIYSCLTLSSFEFPGKYMPGMNVLAVFGS